MSRTTQLEIKVALHKQWILNLEAEKTRLVEVIRPLACMAIDLKLKGQGIARRRVKEADWLKLATLWAKLYPADVDPK